MSKWCKTSSDTNGRYIHKHITLDTQRMLEKWVGKKWDDGRKTEMGSAWCSVDTRKLLLFSYASHNAHVTLTFAYVNKSTETRVITYYKYYCREQDTTNKWHLVCCSPARTHIYGFMQCGCVCARDVAMIPLRSAPHNEWVRPHAISSHRRANMSDYMY